MRNQKRKMNFGDAPYKDIRYGNYTDQYFNYTNVILEANRRYSEVIMQVFNKVGGIVCGLDESIMILKNCIKDLDAPVEIHALYDGDTFSPFETVMTIKGQLHNFTHLETIILGIIARGTKVATNTNNVVSAANGKNVLFFPARFDRYENQRSDGYAALIGGASNVSTPQQSIAWEGGPTGTMPHALIAAYEGNTALATFKYAKTVPNNKIISLVDFENDCCKTAVETAQFLMESGFKLDGVRLDTSGTMVDASVVPMMTNFKPTGVCPQLVLNVRNALDNHGFPDVKIYVSGGFNPEKIAQFEHLKLPVDGYGVGSSMYNGNYDFTADVVVVNGNRCAKVGRHYNSNPRLELV